MRKTARGRAKRLDKMLKSNPDFLQKAGALSVGAMLVGSLPAPGVVAHQLALKDGETLKIPQFG